MRKRELIFIGEMIFQITINEKAEAKDLEISIINTKSSISNNTSNNNEYKKDIK